GILAAMSAVFAEHGVSVHSVIQRGQNEADTAELVYVTHSAREGALRATLDDIAKLDHVLVDPDPTLIRVIK
ncbi:MAG: ACT domain-containing protein, partial [Schwartzia sp.]|nr:ACT domain-containing protein [Schwartzia sp. (in: firmicutes)]